MNFSYGHIPKWVWVELVFRIVVFIIFLITEELSPYHRVIQPEEAWLYRFPNKDSIIPSQLLWVILLIATISVIVLVFGYNKDVGVTICVVGVITLALPLNGIITNIIKVTVGRPRPDYLERCYGGEYLTVSDYSKPCTTPNQVVILDGRKSFPSGHSSMSFCGFGVLFLFLAAQLKVFSSGRGRSPRLLVSCLPLLTATLVAISRTCDYHHHWQDIVVGSILGFTVAWGVYRQYFPGLGELHCDKPDVGGAGYEQGAGDAGGNGVGRLWGRRGMLLESPTGIKTV